jgi:hypothetical protein
MNAITSFVTRHPLVTFFGLAYVFSSWPSLIEARGILPLGPLVAALIVTAIIGRGTRVKSFNLYFITSEKMFDDYSDEKRNGSQSLRKNGERS